jgi:hypothetical protein
MDLTNTREVPMVHTDGSGIYKRDSVLGPFDEPTPKTAKEVIVPQIEEIRAIRGADGEDYINLKDLTMMMNQERFRPMFMSLSVYSFTKHIIKQLLIARR